MGIRPKGNTSLSAIAADPDTDRYSLKLEFDHYVDGQTCLGLDKLILNKNYADSGRKSFSSGKLSSGRKSLSGGKLPSERKPSSEGEACPSEDVSPWARAERI